MKKKIILFTAIALLMLSLSGCVSQPETPMQGASISGVTLNEDGAGQNANFIIVIKQAQEDVGLDFWASITEGDVSIAIQNKATGEIVFEKPFSDTVINFNTVITLPKGEYDLLVTWVGPVKGNYNLEWQPGKVEIPEISLMILIPGSGMLIVGMFFFIFAVRQASLKMAMLGGTFWLGTVFVKFIIAWLINSAIYTFITNALPGLTGIILFSIYVGLLTGITEILITWLILRYTQFGQRVWKEILSFSIGFGAFEAVMLGAISVMGMIATLTMTDQMLIIQLRNVALANSFLYGLAPIVERIFTIFIHMGCNVLLFYSVRKKEMRWFWISFALKSGIDAVAGYAQLSGQLQSTAFIWIIEVFVILFGLAGFWFTRKLYPLIKKTDPVPEAEIISA